MEDLELALDNPYAYGDLLTLPDGSVDLVFNRFSLPESEEDRIYRTVTGDTFSNIAFEVYGTSKLWWLIWAISGVENPLDLEELPGTLLRIPPLTVLDNLQ